MPLQWAVGGWGIRNCRNQVSPSWGGKALPQPGNCYWSIHSLTHKPSSLLLTFSSCERPGGDDSPEGLSTLGFSPVTTSLKPVLPDTRSAHQCLPLTCQFPMAPGQASTTLVPGKSISDSCGRGPRCAPSILRTASRPCLCLHCRQGAQAWPGLTWWLSGWGSGPQ